MITKKMATFLNFCLHKVSRQPKSFPLVFIISLATFIFSIGIQSCATVSFSKTVPSPWPAPPLYPRPKIALVLGGGGAKGLAHVGVLEELLKAGIYPDLIVGCSAGAAVGALYADSHDIKLVRNLLLNGKRGQFISYALTSLPFGLSSGSSFTLFLKKHLSARSFKELKTRFIAVATNLETGALTPFWNGEIIPAVLASAAYPGLFYPVRIKNQFFIDGGAANPVPVEVAKKLGAEFIIAVDIGEMLTHRSPKHLFGVAKRSLEISYIHHSALATREADFVFKIPFQNVGTFTDSLNYQIYSRGVETAKERMPRLKETLKKKFAPRRRGVKPVLTLPNE